MINDTKTQKVLQAATTIFLQHGFSAATTDMIQREAKVSKATLYACYPNKEALFAAVIEHQCHQQMMRLKAMDVESEDIVVSLSNLGRAYLQVILSPGLLNLFRVVVAEAPRFPELSRRFFVAGPQVAVEVFSKHLAKAVDEGQLDIQSVGLESAANLIIGLIRSEAQMECLTHPNALPSEAQLDKWVHLGVSTFMRAFSTERWLMF